MMGNSMVSIPEKEVERQPQQLMEQLTNNSNVLEAGVPMRRLPNM
jgi:hypothetical protein